MLTSLTADQQANLRAAFVACRDICEHYDQHPVPRQSYDLMLTIWDRSLARNMPPLSTSPDALAAALSVSKSALYELAAPLEYRHLIGLLDEYLINAAVIGLVSSDLAPGTPLPHRRLPHQLTRLPYPLGDTSSQQPPTASSLRAITDVAGYFDATTGTLVPPKNRRS